MNPSFVVYIDESGDEGFVFNADGSGSSRWFVLSAAVIRKTNDLQMVRSVEHSRLAGLQVADAVASGLHFAVKVNRYGETETGYLTHLKKTLYRHQKAVMGYGVKVWPEDFATLKAKAPETVNLEGLL